jgi:rubrerythrin
MFAVMSIIESLKKLVDPEQAREEEAGRLVARNLPQREDAAPPPAIYQCRVCGHTGNEKVFCPTCLAETMRKQD